MSKWVLIVVFGYSNNAIHPSLPLPQVSEQSCRVQAEQINKKNAARFASVYAEAFCIEVAP